MHELVYMLISQDGYIERYNDYLVFYPLIHLLTRKCMIVWVIRINLIVLCIIFIRP